ncbi:FimV/HubP family polar landmark protein [Cellvibrio sp. pealriver]|uniref:FimV/HubP family polar landmark protein n=1 Tax=Cellvibrio sp. pealriver TaxID=1622269 RepID=UPI00066FC946|nr:FimV/HubP family polar landmark protein [Cellvibrio sp. pealriver]
MRLRQLVLACGLTSFVLSPYVSALGLGEVTLKSSLNQPLEAEVKLLDTRDLTAEQILVALASPADFERNGVDRLYFYTEFQFEVVLNAAGGPKVIITSRSPVREPYLNFLIEARWTAGRLLREYTLLMDLPTFDENGSSQSVQAATQSTSQSQPGTAPVSGTTGKKSESSYQTPRASAPKASLNGDEYEVRQNDTLWDIALRARSDSSISVHQSMMALYRANPDAFINGNINRLRRGQVLRIPDAEEMKSLGKSEAVSQFAQATGDSDSGAQLSASRRTSVPSAEPTEASGRVKLAAPSSGTSAGQGSGANDGAGKALESELAATLEELDKSKSENTELSARVKDLEEQIQTMERLVEVSNEKLRALQVSAAKPTEGTEQPIEGAEITSSASPEPAAIVANATSSTAAKSSQPAAPKVVAPPAPAPTLADKAIENAPWIGLGVLGLLGAGVFAYRRRKQAEAQQEEQEDIFAMDDSVAEREAPVSESEAYQAADDASLFEEDDESTAVAETGDVVGEADIYIAYGKLDQAEEMLINALQKDPESADIRMKLLEVYAQQQNAPAFDKHYAALLPLAGAAVLARASELRDGIAGAGEFDAADTSPVNQDGSNDNFSLDDFNLDEELAQTAATNEQNADFDFSLDFDDHEENLASVQDDALASNSDESAASSNEFQLDLDDDFSLETEPDDLSELSLALDDLNTDSLPNDIETTSPVIEEDFSFDLDLADTAQDSSADSFESNELSLEDVVTEGNESEALDVVADDFNLDMDVDDVDLAALDHEMESLDLDMDFDSGLAGDELEGSEKNVTAELNSLVDPGSSALDDTQNFITNEFDNLSGEISTANLTLTDDLDKFDQSKFIEKDDGEIGDLSIDSYDQFEVDINEIAEDESLIEVVSDNETGMAEIEELQNEQEKGFDQANDFSADFAFADASAAEQSVIDLELQDEIPTSNDFAGVDVAIDDPVAPKEVQDNQDEDLFAQALSDFSAEDELDLNAFSSDEAALDDLSDEEMDAELDFLADADEAATKLDLARAYIDMGDADGAKDILAEVLGEGSDEQRKEANELLARIG